MQAFNSSMFSCQNFSFLTKRILLAKQKARKAIDNARVILNKIHLALFKARGGGDSYMKQTGMLVGNFEFNP